MAKQVTAYQGYEIYADYDANAPDTKGLLLCDTEELAIAVCEKLNETPRKWGNMAFVEGYEWSKSFQHRPVIRLNDDFPKTIEEVMANVEVGDDEDEDSED
jgi:hypothetical protein